MAITPQHQKSIAILLAQPAEIDGFKLEPELAEILTTFAVELAEDDFGYHDAEVSDEEIANSVSESLFTPTTDGESLEAQALAVKPYTNEEFAKALIANARSYANANVSRSTALWQVERFLNLFGLNARYADGKWVPFCAAGLSYAAIKAYCDLSGIKYDATTAPAVFKAQASKFKAAHFLPSPSVGFIKEDAQKRKLWVPQGSIKNTDIKAGWPIVFSWEGKSWPNHIGLVLKANANNIETVEFNVSSTDNRNGGAVAYRTRNYAAVQGYVRTW